MSDKGTVNKSVIVTLKCSMSKKIIADVSSSDIIILSVFDGHERPPMSIDRALFKEFVTAIGEV